jgi:hypothetical protein
MVIHVNTDQFMSFMSIMKMSCHSRQFMTFMSIHVIYVMCHLTFLEIKLGGWRGCREGGQICLSRPLAAALLLDQRQKL